jgi:multidrug resistance efflux pump
MPMVDKIHAAQSFRGGDRPAGHCPGRIRNAHLRPHQRLREALYTDIGTPVKAGDLLAEIDSPEIDRQLQQTCAQLVQMQAALAQAQANMELAKVTTDRSAVLVRQGWTSRQQGDQDRLTFAASTAAVDVARADVQA